MIQPMLIVRLPRCQRDRLRQWMPTQTKPLPRQRQPCVPSAQHATRSTRLCPGLLIVLLSPCAHQGIMLNVRDPWAFAFLAPLPSPQKKPCCRMISIASPLLILTYITATELKTYCGINLTFSPSPANKCRYGQAPAIGQKQARMDR